MSSGVYTGPVNWVFDTLFASASTASTALNAYVDPENVLLVSGPTPMQNRTPAILVRLPTEEWNVEEWKLLMQTHGGEFAILVECFMHPTKEPNGTYVDKIRYPYGKAGDTTRRGSLTLLEDALNALEAASNGLRAGGTALGIKFAWRPPRMEASGLQVSVAAVIPSIQFAAAGR